MTSPSESPDDPRAVSTALGAVAITGAAITLLSALFGVGTTSGVLLGSVIATANLWVLGRVVRALFQPHGARIPWSLAAVVKFAGLVLGLYLLVERGFADVLSLILGYAALPLGIVLGELGASRATTGDTPNA